jgi:hypothetical protein
MPAPARRAHVVAMAGLILLTGCALGPRPTLGQPKQGTTTGATGDANLDALLKRLDSVADKTFTATYKITRLLGSVTGSATVSQQPPNLSVTVGDTRFLIGAGNKTCSLSTHQCQDGILEQKLSELSISTSFWADSPSRQIRVTYKRRDGQPQFSTKDVGGITADCVAIPVGAGAERYCVAPNGVIADVERADVLTQLTAYQEGAPDPTVFAAP